MMFASSGTIVHGAGTVHSGTVLYLSVVIGEFGGVPHSCYINGEAMVIFRPFSLQLSCSLSNVFLR